jgi:hypothetical protein
MRIGCFHKAHEEIWEQTINTLVRQVCFGRVVSVEVSSEICPHKAENSRPSPFFSCGKMNLVILGISSTRMGHPYRKTGTSTTLQHFDPSSSSLLWNLAHLDGTVMRNSKASCGCWFCTTLLVYGGADQLKWESSSSCLNKTALGERKRFPMCTHTRTLVRIRRSVVVSHGVFCHIKSLQI